jgi:hypothetical protein
MCNTKLKPKERLFSYSDSLHIAWKRNYRCPKKIVPFFIFFSRCPVCGEWCKLHWLRLDTPSFDWNTRRSCGHKIFLMAPTKQQKAFCAVEYAKTTSVITVQRNFRRHTPTLNGVLVMSGVYCIPTWNNSRSQWPRGLRRSSSASRLLRLLVRIPPEAWMFIVSVVGCQVEVSALGWSLVQRSTTECVCVIKCRNNPLHL